MEEKLEQTLQEFVSQSTRVAEAQKNVLTNTQEHGRLMKGITSEVAEDLQTARNTAGTCIYMYIYIHVGLGTSRPVDGLYTIRLCGYHMGYVGTLYEVEKSVQIAQGALRDATDRHKTLFHSLKELMARAKELGLKSKVMDKCFPKSLCLKSMTVCVLGG